MGSHMDAAKLDHIHLLGAQLMWLRQHTVHSPTSDLLSLKPSDLEPSTTARGVSPSAFSTDTGFVSPGCSGWAVQGVLTAASWSGVPVMSARIKPPLAASSEPVLRPSTLRPSTQIEYETTISSLQQTIADQNARIAALELKLGDVDELVARCC